MVLKRGKTKQRRHMRGGSLASSFVENYANKADAQQLDEYKTLMDLPGKTLKGGSQCGVKMNGGGQCGAKAMNGGGMCGNHAKMNGGGMCGAQPRQDGGARSLTEAAVQSATPSLPEVMPSMAEVKSMPRLYQMTGGRRCSSKTKRRGGCGSLRGGSRHRRRTARRSKRSHQRGGSFWNYAGFGPINTGEKMFQYDHHFTRDTSHPSYKDLMDPPTKEKAGSGDKLDLSVGASYPFN